MPGEPVPGVSFPAEILDRMNGVEAAPLLDLSTPRQLEHGGQAGPALTDAVSAAPGYRKIDTRIAESVAYSPAAARPTFENQLLWTETLTAHLSQGYDEVPGFPTDAVLIKPVSELISKTDLSADGLFTVPAWPGTPAEAQAFPNTDWNQCVYVDPANSRSTQASDAALDGVMAMDFAWSLVFESKPQGT